MRVCDGSRCVGGGRGDGAKVCVCVQGVGGSIDGHRYFGGDWGGMGVCVQLGGVRSWKGGESLAEGSPVRWLTNGAALGQLKC